jgi:hypothetical protein
MFPGGSSVSARDAEGQETGAGVFIVEEADGVGNKGSGNTSCQCGDTQGITLSTRCHRWYTSDLGLFSAAEVLGFLDYWLLEKRHCTVYHVLFTL